MSETHPCDGYTIGEVARLYGITVRTLHHWDAIGLASPSERTWAGHRIYSDADVERVQNALVYRETGMSLEVIRHVGFTWGCGVACARTVGAVA